MAFISIFVLVLTVLPTAGGRERGDIFSRYNFNKLTVTLYIIRFEVGLRNSEFLGSMHSLFCAWRPEVEYLVLEAKCVVFWSLAKRRREREREGVPEG